MKNYFESPNILRIFIGFVFIAAAIYRILNWNLAVSEIQNIGLPYTFLPNLIIFIEIIGGLSLIFNIKTKSILKLLILFLLITLTWAIIVSGQALLNNISELFIFNLNPTDFFLHFTYLIILVYLLYKR